MSENYFQHADHFTRILSEQEFYKKNKASDSAIVKIENNVSQDKKIENLTEETENNSEKI